MGRFKKCILLLLTLITTMSFALPAYAETQLTPRWNYLLTVYSNLEIDSRETATASVTCVANANSIDKLVVTAELQKLDSKWSTVKKWTVTENNSYVNFTKSSTVTKNYSYRLKITAKAYSGSTLKETVTEYYDYGYYN